MPDIFEMTTRPDREVFFTRHDPHDPRLGEIVQSEPEHYSSADIVIVGCPQDEGVRRNGGRVGAAFIGLASDTSVVEEYDPAADKWSATRARMPSTRSALGYAVINGRIYVAGGEFQDTHIMATFKAVEAYDPASNTWSIMPPMPVSRHGLAAGAIGNRLFLVGGDVQSSGTGVDVSTSEVDALVIPAGDH